MDRRHQLNQNSGEDVVRWGAGCLVSAAATTGLVILALLIAIALTPPTWVQVLVGVGLALGGALLAWLVASALDQSRKHRSAGRPDLKVPKDPGA